METEEQMKSRHAKEMSEAIKWIRIVERQQIDSYRIHRETRHYRLWMKSGDRWQDMTETPLMWFANKRMGVSVARVKMERYR